MKDFEPRDQVMIEGVRRARIQFYPDTKTSIHPAQEEQGWTFSFRICSKSYVIYSYYDMFAYYAWLIKRGMIV